MSCRNIGNGKHFIVSTNDPDDGAAGADVDFRTRWPPPLPCVRWLSEAVAVSADRDDQVEIRRSARRISLGLQADDVSFDVRQWATAP